IPWRRGEIGLVDAHREADEEARKAADNHQPRRERGRSPHAAVAVAEVGLVLDSIVCAFRDIFGDVVAKSSWRRIFIHWPNALVQCSRQCPPARSAARSSAPA